MTVEVLFDTADRRHIVVPARPGSVDGLSPEELEEVAAGPINNGAPWTGT